MYIAIEFILSLKQIFHDIKLKMHQEQLMILKEDHGKYVKFSIFAYPCLINLINVTCSHKISWFSFRKKNQQGNFQNKSFLTFI